MARIRANGIDIEYETFGPEDGVPLLLIHGFGQQLIAWPEEFVDGLTKAGLSVIRFDNRDTGLSRKWDGQIPDSGAVMAAAHFRKLPTMSLRYSLPEDALRAGGSQPRESNRLVAYLS